MRKLLLTTYMLLFLLGFSLILVFIPKFTPEYMGFGVPSSALPNLLATCICFFAFMEFVKEFIKKNDKPSAITWKNLLHLVKLSAIALLSFPCMEYAGFIPGAILTLLLFQWVCGQRNILLMISLSVGIAVVIYLLATYILIIPLP